MKSSASLHTITAGKVRTRVHPLCARARRRRRRTGREAAVIKSNHRQEQQMAEESQFKGQTGLRRVWNVLHDSRAGLRAALLIPLAIVVSAAGLGRALLIGSVLLVLLGELRNSAIEATVDRISLDQHPSAKRAKDIGSAAVLLVLLTVLAVWACVLLG
jgi:diacylglycerol kinase (ATP)